MAALSSAVREFEIVRYPTLGVVENAGREAVARRAARSTHGPDNRRGGVIISRIVSDRFPFRISPA
jgi:hypothetical protein